MLELYIYTALRTTATGNQTDWYIVTGGGSIQSGGPKIRKKMFDKRNVGKRAKKLLEEKDLASAVNICGAHISDMQLISNYNTVFKFLLYIFNFISHKHLLMKNQHSNEHEYYRAEFLFIIIKI